MLLLDTHTLLWFLFDDSNLPKSLREEIINADGVYVSIAVFWEITIKKSLGKLDIDHSIEEIMNASEENDIKTLSLKVEHFKELMKLEYIHRDPFDRIMISQSLAENMTFLTKDENIHKYNADVRWN